MEHDHELLQPQVISTWMPNGVGSMAGNRVIFAETQVFSRQKQNGLFLNRVVRVPYHVQYTSKRCIADRIIYRRTENHIS